MDTGLIFPDRQLGDGGTEHIHSGALLDWRQCSKICSAGKSAGRYREQGALLGSPKGTAVKRLPRKTSKLTSCTSVPQTDTGVQLE